MTPVARLAQIDIMMTRMQGLFADLQKMRRDIELEAISQSGEPFSVIAAVAAALNVEPALILSPSRLAPVSAARKVVCVVLRECRLSFPKIGMVLSRDHSTIIHSAEAGLRLIAASETYSAAYRAGLAAWSPTLLAKDGVLGLHS